MTLALSISLQRIKDSPSALGESPLRISGGQLLLAAAAGCYLLGSALLRAVDLPRRRTVPVLLRCEERRCLLRALVDTGNTLQDPATGAPVLIVDHTGAKRLFPTGLCPTQEQLRHPEQAISHLASVWDSSRLRLLPYSAVGVDSGLLLAVRLDSIEAGGKPFPGRLAAVMPGTLEPDIHGLIGI